MYKFLLSLFLLLSTLSATARKVVRVACVGNSITYGTGIANREQDAYPAQLQRMLGKDYVVGNFGKPGATLLRHGHRPYFQQTEFRDAMQFKGDIAVIHLGINEIGAISAMSLWGTMWHSWTPCDKPIPKCGLSSRALRQFDTIIHVSTLALNFGAEKSPRP